MSSRIILRIPVRVLLLAILLVASLIEAGCGGGTTTSSAPANAASEEIPTEQLSVEMTNPTNTCGENPPPSFTFTMGTINTNGTYGVSGFGPGAAPAIVAGDQLTFTKSVSNAGGTVSLSGDWTFQPGRHTFTGTMDATVTTTSTCSFHFMANGTHIDGSGTPVVPTAASASVSTTVLPKDSGGISVSPHSTAQVGNVTLLYEGDIGLTDLSLMDCSTEDPGLGNSPVYYLLAPGPVWPHARQAAFQDDVWFRYVVFQTPDYASAVNDPQIYGAAQWSPAPDATWVQGSNEWWQNTAPKSWDGQDAHYLLYISYNTNKSWYNAADWWGGQHQALFYENSTDVSPKHLGFPNGYYISVQVAWRPNPAASLGWGYAQYQFACGANK